jgi:hypothetical protein
LRQNSDHGVRTRVSASVWTVAGSVAISDSGWWD